MRFVEATEREQLCFLGEFEYAVDAQRRVALPKQWRPETLASPHFFLHPWRGNSLQLVPAAMFLETLAKVRAVAYTDPEAVRALASIGSVTQEVTLDKQGRFALSDKLLKHAGIVDKTVMIGAISTILIYEPKAWDATRMPTDAGLNILQAIQERPDVLPGVLQSQ